MGMLGNQRWMGVLALTFCLGLAGFARAADLPAKFVIADGTPEQMLEAIESLLDMNPPEGDDRRAQEFLVNQQLGVIAGSDRLMAKKPSLKIYREAAKLQMDAWAELVDMEHPGAGKQAITALAKLEKSADAEIANLSKQTVTSIRMAIFPTLTAPEQNQLLDQTLASLKESDYAQSILGQALTLGSILEEMDDQKAAVAYYKRLCGMLTDTKKPRLQKVVAELTPMLRRIDLVGKELAIDATTFKGDKLDWSAYKGKVVLVEFWATWCGPCVAEMPHIRKTYDTYHEQGFEVVGISLDSDKAALAKFLAKNAVPWPILFDANQAKPNGQNPVAEYYGVNAIPVCFLVGRDGKVLSINARGENLDALMATQFKK